MKVLTCLVCGFLLRHAGYWLCEWGQRIEYWAGVEPIKAGGTTSE